MSFKKKVPFSGDLASYNFYMYTIIPLSPFKIKEVKISGEVIVYNIHLFVVMAYKSSLIIIKTKYSLKNKRRNYTE